MKKTLFIIILALSFCLQTFIFTACGVNTAMNLTEIYDLKTEDLADPIGIDEKQPEFSWKMRSSVIGQKQNAYRIKVYKEKDLVWDSNKVLSDVSVNVKYGGTELCPATKYNWTVTVWDKDNNITESEKSYFETGIYGNFNDAYFISYNGNEKNDNLPVFRKSFKVKKGLVSAKLYTAGLGVYESYLNGETVGNKKTDGSVEYFALKPSTTEPSKRQFYNSFNVKYLLNEGENVLTSVVTNGWWSGLIAANYGKENAYLAKLVLTYEDGSKEEINTDTSFKSARVSPVIYGDIYNGQTYDARVSTDFMKPGFDDTAWQNVKINREFNGQVVAYHGTPIKIKPELEIKPASVTVYKGKTDSGLTKYGKIKVVNTYDTTAFTLEKGQTALIDFGQNFSGVEKFTVSGKAGTVLSVEHGEMLNDNLGEKSRHNDGPGGSMYNANLRSAKALTTFTLSGEKDTFYPAFTYYGFRYAEITATDTVTFEKITGQVISSVDEFTGTIKTDNDKINRLISNIKWGMLSNYLGTPTDCPQRDERLGWSADTQVFALAGSYLEFSKTFLEKYFVDLQDAQDEQGRYPGVAPTGQYRGATYGETGWADAAIIVPYVLLTMFDDVSAIKEGWESIRKYMDEYLGSTNGNGPRCIDWGDWLSYEPNDEGVKEILAVCYYAYDALLMSKMAKRLGYEEEAEKYEKVYLAEKEIFGSRYVNFDGTLIRGEQTVCLYALYLDLLDDKSSVEKVSEQLVNNIISHGNKLQTGFLGTKILMETLTKIGRTDIAYKLLLQEDNPSWLYSVNQGATTIWERWDSYTLENGFQTIDMNSFNHYAYGAVASWMFGYMAGINYDENTPAFKHFVVSPEPDASISYVEASYNSVYGTITAKSEITDNNWDYKFTVPANTSATVKIPAKFINLIINGKQIKQLKKDTDGIVYLREKDGYLYFEAVAGSFALSATFK